MFNQDRQELFIPDGRDPRLALASTTHLAVSAHQDDIEIMAIDGILKCYQNPNLHFTGCTLTDGRGTPRAGEFAHVSDEEMAKIRHEEQKEAARVGQYSAQVLLGYSSQQVREAHFALLAGDLDQLLRLTQPRFVYTHNLADKHKTHTAVALRVIEAIRRMPAETRPEKLYGCEVWRSLDFLPDNRKLMFDVSAHGELQSRLLKVFRSQIAGGKNYEQAVIGRRIANATFTDPYRPDKMTRLSFAMDMTELITNESLSPESFMEELLGDLGRDIQGAIAALGG